MKNADRANLPVTQEDRDAAKSLLGRDDAGPSWWSIDSGNADNDPLVQAFARHRLSSIHADTGQAEGLVERLGGYQRVFNAIAAATSIYPAPQYGLGISISVQAFADALSGKAIPDSDFAESFEQRDAAEVIAALRPIDQAKAPSDTAVGALGSLRQQLETMAFNLRQSPRDQETILRSLDNMAEFARAALATSDTGGGQ